ncbi:GNAT family N-acetyltransferase [Thalassobacillus hwangdonensis]|uniref:GNAT family N-acetyltransferase n=1 Tax=Thalassobacillus hwangdonensis TaxID=546108 RepID=A0ABW3L1D7_9BACI
MFLHTIDEELALKLPELKDAEKVFELTDVSRKYLREWLPWVDGTTTIEDTKGFLEGTRKGFLEERSLTTLILYKGEIVGTAGFNELNRANDTAYIGYWLGEGYQGKGIMTRVVCALVDYAFTELDMNKVDIRAAEGNAKSRAIPERLGFTFEGRIRQAERLYGNYVDHMVYGILESEWNQTKA